MTLYDDCTGGFVDEYNSYSWSINGKQCIIENNAAIRPGARINGSRLVVTFSGEPVLNDLLSGSIYAALKVGWTPLESRADFFFTYPENAVSKKE